MKSIQTDNYKDWTQEVSSDKVKKHFSALFCLARVKQLLCEGGMAEATLDTGLLTLCVSL